MNIHKGTFDCKSHIMTTATQNKAIVTAFINDVWNGKDIEKVNDYLHEAYEDHSFPQGFDTGRDGVKTWVQLTSRSFEHTTHIKSAVADDNMVALQVELHIKHVGDWRHITATGKEATVKGFRFYMLAHGLIIAHWGLIDGEALQAALEEIPHGCAVK